MKKLILCLVLVLVCTPGSVTAYDNFFETLGEAIPQEDGVLLVSGVGLTEDAWDEVFLYIEDAEIYDLRTGFAIDFLDIYEGDCVRVVYHQGLEGYPMALALEIYVHAGEPDSADFMVVVSDNIWYSDEGCSFVTVDGKYRITLMGGVLLYDEFGYKMSCEEISPGMEMFVWASLVTASFPGQVIPDKIVLLR